MSYQHDFKNPDYHAVFKSRDEFHSWIKNNPKKIAALKTFYKNNPAQFISDWGVTFDPRNVEIGLPSVIPFILFERQTEWINWVIDKWRNRQPGLTEKSREMGVSWLMVALSVTLCLFNEGVAIGMGSRKEEYVDEKGNMKSLFHKARFFIQHLPREFRGDWDERKHSPYMKILFPDTGSMMSGEAGDNIGRGDRSSIYFVDEAAWIPRSELLEASLSQTTNCRIDVSTPKGHGNAFARKRFAGKVDVFSLHWSSDPRKDQAWYEEKCRFIDDPIVIAQELDMDYEASASGVIINAKWVQAAIDAHIKLGIKPTGIRRAGVDIADEGADKNAFCGRHGFLIERLDMWSGENSDLFKTTENIFRLADDWDYKEVLYDADGLGAGIRGDTRVINSKRTNPIIFNQFRGSGAVIDPEADPFIRSESQKDGQSGRKNEDYFENYKAQSWWKLRQRFELTYRAINEGFNGFDENDIISISSKLPNLNKLIVELSQPTYTDSKNGKLMINKKPANAKSPNLADAVMIAFSPTPRKIKGAFSVF